MRKEVARTGMFTRQEAIEKLLKSYESYFNIQKCEPAELPLIAVCEFFQHTERFVMSKSAGLGAADGEEFLYMFDLERLTLEAFEKCMAYVKEDADKRANIGPDHMYTYVTPIFICDCCDEEAKKALKRCRIHKSFRFTIYGWMDYRVALLEAAAGRIFTNRSGKIVEKMLKKILQ